MTQKDRIGNLPPGDRPCTAGGEVEHPLAALEGDGGADGGRVVEEGRGRDRDKDRRVG